MSIAKIAYAKYQLDWMQQRGLSLDDLVKELTEIQFSDPEDTELHSTVVSALSEQCQKDSDSDGAAPEDAELRSLSVAALFDLWQRGCGFAGSLWACFDEFLGAEYQDVEYMKSLLTEKEYAQYLEETGRKSSAPTGKANNVARTVELAVKLRLKENERLIQYIPKWIEDSELWAMQRAHQDGTNPDIPGLRHLYVMNHLCPSLHHFHKIPDPRGITLEQLNKAIEAHMRENTQDTLYAENGQLLQAGVVHDKENWEVLQKILQDIYAEHAKAH